MDMTIGFGLDKALLVQHNGIFRIWEDSSTGTVTRGAEKLLESAGPVFTRPRSATYDARGNLYIADFGNGDDGSIIFLPPAAQIYIPEPRDCNLDKMRIVRNAHDLGLLRTFDNDSAIVFRGSNGIHIKRLGLSGSIKDANGDPVVGALVRVKTNFSGTTAPTRTNECGNFHILGVKNHISTGGGLAEVTVTVPQVANSSADRVFSTYIDAIGHTIRDFTIDTVVSPSAANPTIGTDELYFPDLNDPNFNIPQVPIDPSEPKGPAKINMIFPIHEMWTDVGTEIGITGTVTDPDVTEVIVSINGVEYPTPIVNGRFVHRYVAAEGYSTISVRTDTPRSDPNSAATQSVTINAGDHTMQTQAVFGYVIDRDSQLPLAGAYIENQTSGNKQYTRSDGYFAFPNEPEGAVDLEVK
jgi:hypothetical protein